MPTVNVELTIPLCSVCTNDLIKRRLTFEIEMFEAYCHAPSPIRPDWRIQTEVRDAILSILSILYWDSY